MIEREYVLGSPAHAGIDLNRYAASQGCYRFPRTRGDRPSSGSGMAHAQEVPPHTRG